jgi:ABC-type nitrate/sulfonate/bicarbonate transport system substrate-binding protein
VRKKILIPALLTIFILGYFAWRFVNAGREVPTDDVRVGWQTAWATQGQIIQSMARTNIPALYDSHPIFLAFQYGPDLNEAAITGNIDVTNSGIVPTVSLIAKDPNWVIVGRVVDFPISIVTRDPAIKNVEDLRGRSFAVPIGGGSHPFALQALKDHNLSIGEGTQRVRVINVKPTEMAIAMSQKKVDAAAIWEPIRTVLLGQGGNVVAETRYVGFIAVNRSFARRYPGRVSNMLKSYIEANLYVAKHRDQTDTWFAEASNLDKSLVQKIKVIEPNLQAKGIKDISIGVSDGDILLAQSVAARMREANLIGRLPRVADYTDMSYLKRALSELGTRGYKTDRIDITKN